MKFTAKKEEVYSALTKVKSAIDDKSPDLKLTNIYIETLNNNKIKFFGTNLDLSSRAIINAEIEENGTLLVSGFLFIDAIKSFFSSNNENDVFFEVIDNKLKLICGKAFCELYCMNGEDYPGIYEDEKIDKYIHEASENKKVLKIPSKDLKKILKQVSFAVSNDETREELRCIFVELKGENLRLVATDSRRLAITNYSLSSNFHENMEFLIPKVTFQELIQILPQDREVTIYISERYLIFNIDEFNFSSKLINKQYVPYERLIPEVDQMYKIKLNRTDFLNILKSLSFLASENSFVLYFRFFEDCLEIVTKSRVGDAKRNITIDYKEKKMDLGFNINLFLDALQHLEGEEIEFLFYHPEKQIILREIESNDYINIIMPVRIRQGELD